MASRKLLTWRGSEGIGVSYAPDSVLVDWWNCPSFTAQINNATIAISGSSWVSVSRGSTGVVDELETITGGVNGAVIFIKNAADFTVRDGVGNLKLAGDFVMDTPGSAKSTLTLLFDGTNWLEISRTDDTD